MVFVAGRPSVTAVAESASLVSNHAAWIEAFRFCRVADLPEGVKQPVTASRILNTDETRALYGDGVFGGPYSADDGVMQRIFDMAVGDIVEKLRFD